MQERPTRRTVLQTATVGGALALAGCMGAEGESDEPAAARSGSPTATESEDGQTHEQTEEGDDLGEWLATANRPGGREDLRYADEVEVIVGHPAVPFAFRPADVTVAPDTTIVWHWGLEAGPKNVSAVDGTFHSGAPIDEVQHTFEYTFTEPGNYRYVCEPLADCGMKGVVRVLDVPESEYPTVAKWLADVEHYDGTVTDRTGRSAVDVTVADPDVNHALSFTPPAIRIDPGTTVVWNWTGEGGAHDIAFVDADIPRSELTAERGATFEHTFESTGVYRYYCRPHQGATQMGAVVVE